MAAAPMIAVTMAAGYAANRAAMAAIIAVAAIAARFLHIRCRPLCLRRCLPDAPLMPPPIPSPLKVCVKVSATSPNKLGDDLSANSVREFLLPAIQNLLKDTDALDPAHKEALEVIMKERSGGALEAIGKVMGAHLGIASSMTSFFGDSGLLGKKESGEQPQQLQEQVESPNLSSQPPGEDTRFRRIMRGNFTDMLKRQG